jgi:hypothetical protein
MSEILNKDYITNFITTDNGNPVPYRWTHGATDKHMGDGLVVYSIIQHMRFKHCLCIGSGGGYIPRIMTQARIDLHQQGIFEGDNDYNWGDIGVTYVIDPCNGVGGDSNLDDPESFYRSKFYPRFIKETSENAFHNFFVLEDIKLDLIFIDGDHSYEGVKKDFELYSQILTSNGMIMIHDTDKEFSDSLIVSEDEKKDFIKFDGPTRLIEDLKNNPGWNLVNLFNFGSVPNKPSSTGLTIINRK